MFRPVKSLSVGMMLIFYPIRMLTILISTWEEGLFYLENAIKIRHPLISYMIIHQTQTENRLPAYLAERTDVSVIVSHTKGLAVSRNIGLKNCKTPYALIADDDVEYIPAGIEELLAILQRRSVDFVLCKIRTPDDEPEYKSYPTEPYRIGELKHWVSSIEIVVDVEKLREKDIYFDERFGLGAKLDRGEEEVFISDLIKNKWKGFYFPIYIVKHPYLSSGKEERGIKEQWFFQGALDARKQTDFFFFNNNIDLLDGLNEKEIAEEYYQRGRRYIHEATLLPANV